MRKLSIALLAAAGVAFSFPAGAQGFGFYFGVRPHHHWHHRHRRHHYNWWDSYAYSPNCRIIVRHHINRWGERVTVRKRICG